MIIDNIDSIMTCLVLVWLKMMLPSEKDEWKLIYKKGNEWLRDNSSEDYYNMLMIKTNEFLSI